jgi:hypothetical protein
MPLYLDQQAEQSKNDKESGNIPGIFGNSCAVVAHGQRAAKPGNGGVLGDLRCHVDRPLGDIS